MIHDRRNVFRKSLSCLQHSEGSTDHMFNIDSHSLWLAISCYPNTLLHCHLYALSVGSIPTSLFSLQHWDSTVCWSLMWWPTDPHSSHFCKVQLSANLCTLTPCYWCANEQLENIVSTCPCWCLSINSYFSIKMIFTGHILQCSVFSLTFLCSVFVAVTFLLNLTA